MGVAGAGDTDVPLVTTHPQPAAAPTLAARSDTVLRRLVSMASATRIAALDISPASRGVADYYRGLSMSFHTVGCSAALICFTSI